MNQPACLNASEARAYLRVSERQWNKLVAAGLVKKLPTLGSYSRTMLDELIRDEEQRAKTVVRLRLEENDEADTEEGRTMDGWRKAVIDLRQGDCLEVMRTLRAMSVDLIVTDPPYMIGSLSAGSLSSKTGTWGDMMNASLWFTAWQNEAKRILRPTGAIWQFCNWRTMPVLQKAVYDAGLSIASMLVWDKQWIGPGGSVGLRPSYEMVALIPMPAFSIPNRGIPDLWQVPVSSQKPTGHPAEKPVSLMIRLIEASGMKGKHILDPFAGSGTTLVAAAQLGCSALGIEVDPAYYELARQRINAETPSLFAGGAP